MRFSVAAGRCGCGVDMCTRASCQDDRKLCSASCNASHVPGANLSRHMHAHGANRLGLCKPKLGLHPACHIWIHPRPLLALSAACLPRLISDPSSSMCCILDAPALITPGTAGPLCTKISEASPVRRAFLLCCVKARSPYLELLIALYFSADDLHLRPARGSQRRKPHGASCARRY